MTRATLPSSRFRHMLGLVTASGLALSVFCGQSATPLSVRLLLTVTSIGFVGFVYSFVELYLAEKRRREGDDLKTVRLRSMLDPMAALTMYRFYFERRSSANEEIGACKHDGRQALLGLIVFALLAVASMLSIVAVHSKP